MNEKNIIVKSTSKINNLIENSGDLSIDISFENILQNDGVELNELKDSNLQSVKISEDVEILNSINSIECELLSEASLEVNMEIDVDGELYISEVDANKYEIDENSELKFNY
jgi:hypothetical protein